MLRKMIADDVFNFIKIQDTSPLTEVSSDSHRMTVVAHLIISVKETTKRCCEVGQVLLLLMTQQLQAQPALKRANLKREFVS